MIVGCPGDGETSPARDERDDGQFAQGFPLPLRGLIGFVRRCPGDSSLGFRGHAFKARPVSDWALNPMWHSWYAAGDKIDETQIRDDARHARARGATAIELDAGWNLPRGAGYSFDGEGDYPFDAGRFPNPKGMIDAMPAAGQRVCGLAGLGVPGHADRDHRAT